MGTGGRVINSMSPFIQKISTYGSEKAYLQTCYARQSTDFIEPVRLASAPGKPMRINDDNGRRRDDECSAAGAGVTGAVPGMMTGSIC